MEVVLASSDLARARSTADRLGGGTPARIDLSDPGSIEASAAEIGRLDHLVVTAQSRAVLSALTPFGELDFTALRDVFEVKLFGTLRLVQALSPQLARTGSIVLLSGVASRHANVGHLAIGAVNAAVEAAGRQLALECAPIRVNVVSPGLVRTEAFDAIPEAEREKMFADSAAALPVGRVGLPEDVALAVLSLMANGYATGTVQDVDGGALLT